MHNPYHYILLWFLWFPFDAYMTAHPSVMALVGWAVGMLSYHQDVRHNLREWGHISQLFAIICLIALFVYGFTRGEWWNFLLAPGLGWFQFRLTKRWLRSPGSWW